MQRLAKLEVICFTAGLNESAQVLIDVAFADEVALLCRRFQNSLEEGGFAGLNAVKRAHAEIAKGSIDMTEGARRMSVSAGMLGSRS